MAIRDFKDLVCWQLSYQLKREAFGFTATGRASRDFKYRDQIRDSSSSAPRNISEGFGRFRPAEFARFLSFARASLIETRNHLTDGRDSGYLSERECSRLSNLARAAERATTNLMLSKQRQALRERTTPRMKRGGAAPSRYRREAFYTINPDGCTLKRQT